MSVVDSALPLLRRHLLLLVMVWTAACAAALLYFIHEESERLQQVVLGQARAVFDRDLLFRRWSAGHQGVYVPVSAATQPDPYLARLPERDVITPSGRVLTLLSPDAIERQLLATGASRDFKVRVVSPDPIRSENLPDAWEGQGLAALARGQEEVSTYFADKGQTHFRLLRPLTVEDSCLGCHGVHNYQVGQIRGALSLSLPVNALLAANRRHLASDAVGYVVLWGLGLGGLILGHRRLRRQLDRERSKSEELSRVEGDLRHLTFHDPLTGLPNRLLFDDRLNQAMIHATRVGEKLAVGVLGIDNFKKLKNTFGVHCGEELLKRVVQRLVATLRADDTLATLAEGRFLLLLLKQGDSDDLTRVVQKVREALREPILCVGEEFFVTATLGVALFPDDAVDPRGLISCADAAFSGAKVLGRNSYARFAADFSRRALETMTMENRLRRALERGELELHYQPQVDGRNGRVTGAEALLRWRHPELGLIAPAEFIPLAEESGLIFTVGAWALHAACKDGAGWYRQQNSSFVMAVNLSARQFQQPDLLDIIDSALALSGLPPAALVLEITEGTIVEDVPRAIETLVELKQRGVRVAIDDFGTGYSSLNYLKNFPVDQVKIDKSFVDDIHKHGNNNVIIASIVSMAHKLNLELVAEGVETEAQRDFLLAHGCTKMQGFYYSRPVEPERFGELINALATGDAELMRWWCEPGRPMLPE
ncbi:MAG: hypothetical protein A2091_06340 [Desulfuromonadales bacterium GWD2_61_12]|nr:MAG: hypothetical protein A2005_02750 [Desulfuromonadales bacterium GWC2_61_20]OGR32287.1 MAG: hypothetical protein A2091_06340 [Desulfuromonadales bacterium GWD2_61_12]HBT83134.1 hypothetical protein [Desulfuromonas sp.]